MSDTGIWTCPMCGHEAIEPIVHAGCPWTHEQDEQDEYVAAQMKVVQQVSVVSAKAMLARLCALARLRSIDEQDVALIDLAEQQITDAIDGIDPETAKVCDEVIERAKASGRLP